MPLPLAQDDDAPAREREAALLARCTAAARQDTARAGSAREANVFQVAAMLLRPRWPIEAQRLLNASETFFADHPAERLAAAEVVRQGWVPGLPRLRDMLSRQLAAS